MESIVIEIRAAEGGQDACDLVSTMEEIYLRAAKLQAFGIKSHERKPGFVSL